MSPVTYLSHLQCPTQSHPRKGGWPRGVSRVQVAAACPACLSEAQRAAEDRCELRVGVVPGHGDIRRAGEQDARVLTASREGCA